MPSNRRHGPHLDARGAVGESAALTSVITSLVQAQSDASAGRTRAVQSALAQAVEVLGDLAAQARGGVHKNPPLVIFGNPPKAADIMSNDVQAIIYRHAKDDDFYCHAFGTEDFELTSRRNKLTISGLVSRTNVQAVCVNEKTVVLRHRRGLNIVEDV